MTCSCSGHVTRDDFFFTLVNVAQQSGRDIQVLEQTRRRGRSSRFGHLSGNGVPEVLYLPCRVIRDHRGASTAAIVRLIIEFCQNALSERPWE